MTAAEQLDPYRDEIETLISTEGVSAGELARRYNVTRGVVIGWASRRGVELNTANRRNGSTAQRRRRRDTRDVAQGTAIVLVGKVTAPELMLPTEVTVEFPEPLRVPFAEAERNQCHRPLWSLEERMGDVCGLPVKPGSSYCEGCHKVLWQPVPKPVRKAKPGHGYYNPVTNQTHWRP